MDFSLAKDREQEWFSRMHDIGKLSKGRLKTVLRILVFIKLKLQAADNPLRATLRYSL
jgi:hypothetical protein